MAANTYAESWRAWDERYADLVVGKRNWQLAAGGLLVVSMILALGMVWIASRGKYGICQEFRV
jgi:type IV secretory pathway TrbF-like protein